MIHKDTNRRKAISHDERISENIRFVTKTNCFRCVAVSFYMSKEIEYVRFLSTRRATCRGNRRMRTMFQNLGRHSTKGMTRLQLIAFSCSSIELRNRQKIGRGLIHKAPNMTRVYVAPASDNACNHHCRCQTR